MRACEFLIEAEATPIGRKYQHIEDLVITNGSYGGLHAVERLRKMGEQGAKIELKWDGMPVIYWGRDADGTFNMMSKNAWEYAKRGKMELGQGIKVKATSAAEVYNFVANTGRPNLEAPQRRQQFAKQIADLWPFLEKASPKQGYLEGGILFWPSGPAKLNKTTGEWDFKPNVTEFHVAANSALGKRIANATVMIAATGFYPSFGSGEEGRLDNVESLSTPEVVVQGTTYVQEPPKLDIKALDKVESYIQQNAAKIDAFLSAKPGLKSPGGVIYSFLNKNLRGPGLTAAFKNYAQENLSKGQFEKVMSDIDGLTVILTAVEQITAVKEQLITQLSTQSHGGIRQTRPEGYVQAPPAGEFKRPLPGQFVKTISQQTWTPNRNLYNEDY